MTAGVAAPAYAGIPVTHREMASGVAFVTGHEDPDEAGLGDRLAGARPLPGHARLLHGRAHAAADRRAADRRGPARGRAGGGGRARHAPRPAHAARDAGRRRRARRGGEDPRAGDHGRRAGRRGCASSSRGSRRARCTAAPSRSRARGRRRARWPPGCARSARAVVEAPAIRIEPLDTPLPPRPRLRPRLRDLAERRRAAARPPARRPRAGRASRSPRSAPARPARCATAASSPTSSPTAQSPKGSSRRSRDVPVERALIARAAEGRDVLPDALRARGAHVDVVALYETVAEPLDDDTRAAAAAADYVLFTSASSVRFFAAAAGTDALSGPRLASIGPATSAELRDARRRARPRGRPAHARRARRGADPGRGAMTRPITFLSDYGLDRRVRRRRPRRDRRDLPRRARDRPHARHPAAGRARAGARCWRARCRTCPPGVHLAVVDPEVGARRRALALRTVEEERLLVGPDNGLLMPAAERFGGVGGGGRDLGLAVAARAGVGHVPRARPVRARSPRGWRAGRRSRRRARRSSPASSSRSSTRSRARRRTRWSRTWSGPTRSATRSSTPRTTTS